MSIIVGISLNKVADDIVRIEINRIKGTNAPDSLNTYKYFIYEQDGAERIYTGGVTHRYGDGAQKLLYKVLQNHYESARV